MLLGAALLLAALSLLLWNQREDTEAGRSVEKILPQVIAEIEEPEEETEESRSTEEKTEKPLYPDPYDPAMTDVEIDGYAYVGYLSIPSLELELPVLAEWDYTRLRIAPCRYAGSTKTDDLVICAHNYTQHFGPIKNLSVGDLVYFTDMDGMVSVYQVAETETLQPIAVEEMTAGEFDLTLFTCTYGGQTRVTVRCERMEES